MGEFWARTQKTLALNDGKYREKTLRLSASDISFLGSRLDSLTGSNKCIFLIQTTLYFPGNAGSCQAPKPANDETALLQSGRGFSLCSLPRLNPLPIQGEPSGGTGSRELARVRFVIIFVNRKAKSREDKAEGVGSRRPKRRDGRGHAMIEAG